MTNFNNCSWSGSIVTGDSTSTFSAYSACSTKRIEDLSLRFNGESPDIILCYISCNDWRNPNVTMNWAITDALPQEGNITDVKAAYALMLSKIETKYPNARIFCFTNLDDTARDKTAGWPSNNSKGITVFQWNEAIKEVAEGFCCDIINLNRCGINYFNSRTYLIEGLHPNKKGHILMANKIYTELMSKY